MRKGLALALALALMLLTCCAQAEETAWVLAGYDTESSGHYWGNHLFFPRMESLTGVHFELHETMSAAEWKKELEKMLTGASAMPDVLFKAQLTAQETQRYYASGALIDLKPYLAEYAPNLSALLAAHPDWEKAITLPDGAIPALPGFNTLQNNNGIWINTVWLKNVRMEMPTTAEELTEVLRAFRDRDPNHNGRKDEVPLTFTSLWDLRFLAHAFGIVANDYYLSADEAGQVTFAAAEEQNRAFLAWLHQLWEEGLIDHNGFTSADTTRAINDDKATMTYGVVFGPSPMSLVPSSQLANYDLMMPLLYEGTQQYRDLLGDVIRGTFAVTSACSDPARMVAWVDTLYGEAGSRLAQAGMEGKEYEIRSDGTWAWLDDAKTVATTVLTEVAIMGGADMPGMFSAEFQLLFDDQETHRAVEMLDGLKKLSHVAYPQVFLTEQDQARVDELWAAMGRYIETTQVHFVTGDLELNDENWAAFLNRLNELGLEEFVSIWQKALK